MIRQSIITILALSCSWSAMAECPENQVCSNSTPAISGHGYPTDLPKWNVAPSENNTIGMDEISVSEIGDYDPDGDKVIADSKTYQWCNDKGDCFANSPSLTIKPSDIDKVFEKGVGFKPLTVTYSGEVDKGYPEATRTFESEPLPVALEYPPDGTKGICYEAQSVNTMQINFDNIDSNPPGSRQYRLSFEAMAFDSLPGVVETPESATVTDVNFYPTTPKFKSKKLPETLVVDFSYDGKNPIPITLTKDPIPPFVGYVMYQTPYGSVFDYPKTNPEITINSVSFDFNMAGSDQDRRTSMVHCQQFDR
ncbi:hypothetical protein [Vibrio campbellii]|jgi:hypothetical protein|uniref:hypothetical protein n=1 Tax=Vibrio campbellii TaxID=680 RepID=UPI0002AE178D|nr:hypothetical protein [Vibrio campbellii]ARV73044.1 hypothetical protein A8140_10090 [Vibrio campbellii CAIM 519 = NBRC 15631 = ATCC 25920]ELU49594.1 hypothetical protein B878_22517 [Vibrio campbellii CAIM 519 = NBRC 15631 = ATCC 25920]HDM8044163.1 hypothetical protein [Vibrio campbellii]